ncbi:MAG: U32 family peptidase, partial [Selenomonadaceae bacterium]|nr:U32 family peptidase [Selenomonadaceae bacterium]
MNLSKDSVELLAPAGTFETFKAAIDAGADAVYLGGKHFNMRVHKNDFNLSDEELKAAVTYAHERGVKLDITLNNLISVEEIAPLEKYLYFLNEIQPDAVIVQDLAVVHLIKKLGLNIPIHASVMMNVNSVSAVEFLKKLGIKRVVVGRELSFAEVKNLREKTGIETEYFIHGDMCFAESGQCIHSGVTFGQSGNRGRCLKPCRWAWKFIDETTGEILDDTSYKLAMGDMCLLRNIPELIQSGIYSFKIEGRMRPPEFVSRIVKAYRRAIDSYIADPTGYSLDENIWQDFFDKRVRKFTTLCAFQMPTKTEIGLSGKREPRFFSEGIVEPSFDDEKTAEIFKSETAIKKSATAPELTVRVSSLDAAKAAISGGANTIYVGGEIFKPLKPFTLDELKSAVELAKNSNVKIILNTPRITRDNYLNELTELLKRGINFDGVLVSNLGSLNLVKNNSDLPIYADFSFNIFNHEACEFLKSFGVKRASASLEMSFAQVKSVVENSALPIEIIIHGSTESMISEHNLIKLYHPNFNEFATPELLNEHFSLVDSAGEIHSIRVDQFNYNHIYFGKDLCLLPYIEKFLGAAALRIEAQDYSPEITGLVTKIYRAAIDGKDFGADFEKLKKITPRKFGSGVYHF